LHSYLQGGLNFDAVSNNLPAFQPSNLPMTGQPQSSQTSPPIDFVTFSLIIDDVVFPDGQTAMGLLGGGGPQTAFGLRLWADRVGLSAGVGEDLPGQALAWLDAMGIDHQGLRRSPDVPTPRAWQVLEEDGRRTQVWRVKGPVLGRQLSRWFDELPPAYQVAKGYHLGVHPEEPDLAFIAALRATGAVVSLEPFRATQRPLTKTELRDLVSAGQIFSPNEAEAVSLVGPGQPVELIARLVEAGAGIVALRRGQTGAIVHHAASGETHHIPAVETIVVDPTGAGNAFGGGFLAGWVLTGNLRLAGQYGGVAASFLVEQVGLPQPEPKIFAAAQRRLAGLVAP
jgi:sugar/nucleoside kinase (ribokinase family)